MSQAHEIIEDSYDVVIVGAGGGTRRCRPMRRHFQYNLGNMSAPPFERILALAEKFVALIDCGDAGDCARLVVEDLIGNVWSNPYAGHP